MLSPSEIDRVAALRAAEGFPAVVAAFAVAVLIQWLVALWDRRHPEERADQSRSGTFVRGERVLDEARREELRKAG